MSPSVSMRTFDTLAAKLVVAPKGRSSLARDEALSLDFGEGDFSDFYSY